MLSINAQQLLSVESFMHALGVMTKYSLVQLLTAQLKRSKLNQLIGLGGRFHKVVRLTHFSY